MSKENFKLLWITVQVILLILPITIAIVITPYNISYDEEYISKVPERAFEENNKLTDFKEAIVAEYDSKGTYVYKEWRLKHKELYYFSNIGFGLIIGIILQMLNVIWASCYNDRYNERRRSFLF